ncbi:MAG: helix-turn-helix transcriptional regulator [Parasporobacterium sp.]|nr:helix-turn-helix transcriptional regulator [Parasporobacterium sp.]
MDREKVGVYLKELRGKRTQSEVAEAVGVTTMAISQYERGERVPNDEMKVRLARYFHKTVEEIFFATA